MIFLDKYEKMKTLTWQEIVAMQYGVIDKISREDLLSITCEYKLDKIVACLERDIDISFFISEKNKNHFSGSWSNIIGEYIELKQAKCEHADDFFKYLDKDSMMSLPTYQIAEALKMGIPTKYIDTITMDKNQSVMIKNVLSTAIKLYQIDIQVFEFFGIFNTNLGIMYQDMTDIWLAVTDINIKPDEIKLIQGLYEKSLYNDAFVANAFINMIKEEIVIPRAQAFIDYVSERVGSDGDKYIEDNISAYMKEVLLDQIKTNRYEFSHAELFDLIRNYTPIDNPYTFNPMTLTSTFRSGHGKEFTKTQFDIIFNNDYEDLQKVKIIGGYFDIISSKKPLPYKDPILDKNCRYDRMEILNKIRLRDENMFKLMNDDSVSTDTINQIWKIYKEDYRDLVERCDNVCLKI